MLTQFFSNLGGKLAEQWASTVLTPAFVFWAGGLVAWVWRHHWTPLESGIMNLSMPTQVALLIGSLMLVIASAVMVQRFELPVLRLLEGYWSGWFLPLRVSLVQRQNSKRSRDDQRFQDLTAKGKNRTPAEAEEYAAMDVQQRRVPYDPHERMPTHLGNILRAAERWPADKYGLDAVICWPRLWLLLPDGAKNEISAARNGLDAGARVWLWSVLFLAWTVWAWWAALVAVLTAFLAYRWMLNAAETYGDLLESSFDVHRITLYKALRWPFPPNASEEHAYGKQLTQYLSRGSDCPSILFTASDK
jgi:hypothetical protein